MRNRLLTAIAALIPTLVLGGALWAQIAPSANPPVGIACAYNSALPTVASGNALWVQCDTHGQLLTTASVSVGGFIPSGNFATLTATGSSADTALPTGSPSSILAFNTGTSTVSCQLTVGAGVATTNMLQIPAGSGIGLSVGSNTHMSCIDQTGSASNLVTIAGGSGLATAGGGGGGSAITNYALETGGNLAAINTGISNLNTAVASPIADCGTNPCGNNIGIVQQRSQYPATAVPYSNSATGTTAATTATLAGASSVTTYICGFSIRANATAAATGNATITGTISGTLNFTQWTAPLASGLGVTEEIFTPCLPASAANTSIAVVSAAPGSGGVVSVSVWGYKL